MNGDTLSVGAVASLQDFANPISIARRLSHETVNCMLVGQGAESFASQEGFERKNMLTDRAKIHYKNRIKEEQSKLQPYAGHDTVGMVCLDDSGKMTAATSTSGLFMKKKRASWRFTYYRFRFLCGFTNRRSFSDRLR